MLIELSKNSDDSFYMNFERRSHYVKTKSYLKSSTKFKLNNQFSQKDLQDLFRIKEHFFFCESLEIIRNIAI